jgi:hypothetical protein
MRGMHNRGDGTGTRLLCRYIEEGGREKGWKCICAATDESIHSSSNNQNAVYMMEGKDQDTTER